GGRRAAAGEAGAADFPERERMTEEDTFAAHADCPRSVFKFAAPALPAAARPLHDPPGAPRARPIATRDKVSRRSSLPRRLCRPRHGLRTIHGRHTLAFRSRPETRSRVEANLDL